MNLPHVKKIDTNPYHIGSTGEVSIHPSVIKYRCKICLKNRKEWASAMCHQCQRDPNAKILVPPPIRVNQRSAHQQFSDYMDDSLKGGVPVTEK